MYDVVIVGASLAGCAAALALQAQGANRPIWISLLRAEARAGTDRPLAALALCAFAENAPESMGDDISQGWQAVQLDTRMRWDKAGFLAACRSTFGFADWFGMNWDALADSLSDVPVSADTGLLVQWRGWGGMARMYPGDFAVACDVLAEFVTRRATRGETVLLALVGEGPQL